MFQRYVGVFFDQANHLINLLCSIIIHSTHNGKNHMVVYDFGSFHKTSIQLFSWGEMGPLTNGRK